MVGGKHAWGRHTEEWRGDWPKAGCSAASGSPNEKEGLSYLTATQRAVGGTEGIFSRFK